MRNRIIHIIIGLLLCLGAHSQILAPMGYGVPASPKKITSYQAGIVIVYENLNDEAELQVWNGDFWYKIENPPLPKLETTTNGTLQIVDLIEFNNSIYLTAAYDPKVNSSATNYILRWDGKSWSNLTNQVVANSLSIEKLIVKNNELLCIGKFSQDNTSFNTLTLDNNEWKQRGNLITRNLANDHINSVAQANNKVYATGNFTSPNSGSYSLAIFDGNQWELAQFPPFIGESIVLGEYNNNVVVYGKSDFTNETIKISSGSLWQDISNGLQDYNVKNVTSFAEIDGSLFAVGSFEEKATNNSINILEYNGSEWLKTNLNLSNIEQLYTDKNSVVVSGDFSDNARINFIGKIYKDQAQIAARVYYDKNGNCKKDANEDWFANYPLTLDGKYDNLSTDKYGQLYLPISKDTYKINAAEINYWKPTCPDVTINASEYKTYYGAIMGVNQQVGISDAGVYIADNQSYAFSDNERKRALVCYQNVGSQPITDASLTLSHTNSITNFTSEKSVVSYAENKATYNVSLSANSKECFYVSYTTTADENVQLTANISLRTGVVDQNVSNNSFDLKYKQGATLVNQKYCDNGKTISKNEEELNYKIGVKNLGNLPALDIKVVDELDTDLYISYKGIVSNTGHNCEVLDEYTLLPNGNYKTKLVWSFNDINLPANEVDDELSETFIDLNVNILPNMIAEGESVCNTAKIYFSYKKGTFDEAITTNEVCSTVGQTSAIIGQNTTPTFVEGLNIGPNPVSEILYFDNETQKSFDVIITNTLGQNLQDLKIKRNGNTSLDVSKYAQGVYFVY
ncbi:MAG: hypothetical protein RLZZ337_140, partial [Bacteroidota bacterium]